VALEVLQEWRQRIIDLPDPDDELAKTEFVPRVQGDQALEPVAGYLPSKSLLPGTSTARAQALCRRLVATHCLYGVDKNPLAVELAKLALWLESHAEGMPLTFLDHRLVVGDSLTGPFSDRLLFRPGKPDTPVEDLFSQGIYANLQRALAEALTLVRRLEASIGSNLAELTDKEALKAKLDKALLPFRVAVAAWSGGVMLGPEKCDDQAYAQFLKAVGETGRIPGAIESESLRDQIAHGLGIESVPEERDGVEAAINSPRAIPALSYDLAFPEVFYPLAVPHGKQGFHAVLGNPPWDAVRPKAKEFFASFDFAILDAPTKRERTIVEKRLKVDPALASFHQRYEEGINEQQRSHEVLFEHQVVAVNGHKTGGDPDLAKLFLERDPLLLRNGGFIGLVVPSAFHANEGATGVRRLYLEKLNMRCCYSFENRRKLFEIHSSFKFATLVAQAGKPTEQFSCAFYLHDDEWLFSDRNSREPLDYQLDFIRQTSGEHLSLLELRSLEDLNAAKTCFSNGEQFGTACKRRGVTLGRELHMTDDSDRFTPVDEVLAAGQDARDPLVATGLIQRGFLVLHEGKTFWQFAEQAQKPVHYVVSLARLSDKAVIVRNSMSFRIGYRQVQNAGNIRTVIMTLFPPGSTSGNTVNVELTPDRRPTRAALELLSLCNSHVFDFLMRIRSTAHVTVFLMDQSPMPGLAFGAQSRLLSHSALRLACNHAGFAPLWQEQLGENWREPGNPQISWPVLAIDDERWALRAAIDAVVADAYGLSREQYAHVLSTFKHTSYPKAPELCLATFDELKAIGPDAFTKKHDPYWDIPLNENLPKPVIDLLGFGPAEDESFTLETAPREPRKRGRRKG
jgi:hypothetical protein